MKLDVIPAIHLPKDQYAHAGAPTEWWWHVGTLKEVGTGRLFGFEINATKMWTGALTQVSITDVSNSKYYQKFVVIDKCPTDWAQTDSTKDWYVKLKGSDFTTGGGDIQMTSPQTDPTNMHVVSSFTDESGTKCSFDLQLNQLGNPLLVWGNGMREINPKGSTPLEKNNYYYSLTNLQVSGSIVIAGKTFQVEGVTWMDHEYGYFLPKFKWMFQNIQLSNKVYLSGYTSDGDTPINGQPMSSHATLLIDGISHFVDTTTTPMGPTITVNDTKYFTKVKLDIKNTDLNIDAKLTIESLVADQVFVATGTSIYEAVASCTGTYNNTAVKGTAWNEQNLAKSSHPLINFKP